MTGRNTKAALPTHVKIMAKGLKTESTVLLEQIKTIDKERLGEYIGELVINETEAAVIRRIFDLYFQGYGTLAIAKMLNEDGIPRKHGYEKWLPSSINYVLNNERYMGDALLQKSYTTETLPFRKIKNDGRLPQYYVENSNPAIIGPATFGRVQEELARRSGKRKISRKAKTEQGKYSSKYALTELLVCSECKSAYRRCTWTASGKKKIVWRCMSYWNNRRICSANGGLPPAVKRKRYYESLVSAA